MSKFDPNIYYELEISITNIKITDLMKNLSLREYLNHQSIIQTSFLGDITVMK